MISISNVEFDRVVQEALNSIPDEFREYLDNVVVEVRGAPDARFMAEHDVPDDLLGLYVGTPLEDRVLDMSEPMPERVFIFRDNLCDMCETRDELIKEIRITVLHEIGHHFGLDEERLDELGYG
jgi:predicted Zn-dependent protease with MMP-like domain